MNTNGHELRDTLTGVKRLITYEPLFDLRDREENYRIAWEEFKRRRLWILDS